MLPDQLDGLTLLFFGRNGGRPVAPLHSVVSEPGMVPAFDPAADRVLREKAVPFLQLLPVYHPVVS